MRTRVPFLPLTLAALACACGDAPPPPPSQTAEAVPVEPYTRLALTPVQGND